MKPLFILGTGGQARDVADVAEALDYRPVFVTHDPQMLAHWNAPEELVSEQDAVRLVGEDFAIGVGDNSLRRRIAERYGRTLRFPTLIHPDTSFGRGQRSTIEQRAGISIFAGGRFGSAIMVGDFVNCNFNVTVSHDCEIGHFATLSPGANVAGNVRIGEGAWIGIGAAINQGSTDKKLEIGAGTTIGSGAVVLMDCEAHSVYAGVPARKIR